MYVYLNNTRVRISPSAAIAKGGEADIYQLAQDKALKVFKAPDHPDLECEPELQEAAQRRLEEHQTKLKAIPTGLPDTFVTPLNLATTKKGRVVGYSMRFVRDAVVLLKLSDKSFRQGTFSQNDVVAAFKSLHESVSQGHNAGVIIGDFNDLNVLVRDLHAYIIDVDSYQFGSYRCRVFTEKFLDPLLADPTQERVTQCHAYNRHADWYAFAVMLMQTLLYVGPYGGIHRPKNKADRVPQGARPLKRITIFSQDVIYPRVALHYGVLPDDLLDYLFNTFTKDKRGMFPRRLLDMEWRTCAVCSSLHARSSCPECSAGLAGLVVETLRVRGSVTAKRIFRTKGKIVKSVATREGLQYVYWEDGKFCRETGDAVLSGPLDPHLEFAICGKRTIVGKGHQFVVLSLKGEAPARHQVDTIANVPCFAANNDRYFWVWNGQLLRSCSFGHEILGQVLAGQTWFQVGDERGFGFYRAGGLSVYFVFATDGTAINDTIQIALGRGQLVEARCLFSQHRVWAFFSVKEDARVMNRVFLMNSAGNIVAKAEAEAGDASWLGSIRGKALAGNALFSTSAAGLVRIDEHQGCLRHSRTYADTERFIHEGCELYALSDGIRVVDTREITALTTTANA